ncbi:hypothetical protein SERLA73DRAFT_138321 [Serpula lacrymans var. lacrymans S7.3]|uniref:Uncharacterized protein n=2 Tax=Serpula lacrymans var. lacrymans TaxID=341189 RepID=F8Q179_SERL3|nr:uncharacterized protein SERLADRAFT_391891 [Serpula lacrymans var. lacrymans S7.9]EGN98057.1 hypothetical protein SERLA73DRAFT_138321 [Serpula lacrymans var. lacrymans S7.3]EGO23649.1 hypothetical protein SERLADRAFT_391891 [Serpula lacrymans var. lacrymans S7.9]
MNPNYRISPLHWGFLFAPKDKPIERGDVRRDSILWHIRTDDRRQNPWVFETRIVNHCLSETLVARVLIAKFERADDAVRIGFILGRLPIRQNDINFTCRVWTIDAIHSLHALRLVNLHIPLVMLEETISKFSRKHQHKMVDLRDDSSSSHDERENKHSAILDLRE